MFGKIHQSFFRSSINDTDPIVRFVFIGMIVYSDKGGVLDWTDNAIAREFNVPITDVQRALAILSAPDPQSRSHTHDGRRIIPIDPERTWGWRVVTKEQYRDGTDRDQDEVRRKAREKKQRQRQKRAADEGRKRRTTAIDSNSDTDTDTENGDISVVPECPPGQGDIDPRVLQAADAYKRLVDEWGGKQPIPRPTTLRRVSEAFATADRELAAEFPGFTWESLFGKMRDQGSFFRNSWTGWDFEWFLRRKRDVLNARKVMTGAYSSGSSDRGSGPAPANLKPAPLSDDVQAAIKRLGARNDNARP